MRYLSIIICSLFVFSCAGKKSSPKAPPPPPPCPYVAGQINTSSGGSNGGHFSLDLGKGYVRFSNINLTLWADAYNVLVDVGPRCLIDSNFWPGNEDSGIIKVIVGHTYIARFRVYTSGGITYAYSSFKVISYRNGVMDVIYKEH